MKTRSARVAETPSTITPRNNGRTAIGLAGDEHGRPVVVLQDGASPPLNITIVVDPELPLWDRKGKDQLSQMDRLIHYTVEL